MRRRRVPLGLVLPIGLFLLVGLLATLQYQWLGQVSEAEREQLSRSLDHRALEFAQDFDLEIGRAYAMFQNGGQPLDPSEPEPFALRYALWQAEAQFPEMVRRIYYVGDPEDPSTLMAYSPDEAGFSPAAWPAHLESVLERLQPLDTAMPPSAGQTQIIRIAGLPVMTHIPAIVVPLPDVAPDTSDISQQFGGNAATEVMVALHLGRRVLIVDLDGAYLRDTVLPALAERHFPENEAERYRVSIVDETGSPLLTRGSADQAPVDDDAADASANFFSLRLDLARNLSRTNEIFTWNEEVGGPDHAVGVAAMPLSALGRGRVSIVLERNAATTNVTQFETAFGGTGWRLLLQHAAGSLDAAVAEARQHNLMLSFGILAMLAASVGLIVLNARRSERLAAQQMDFVATVSHELRTPLAVIRSAAQNLSAGVIHDAEQAKRYGELIDSEGRRLTDMVEQVLEYAGIGGNRRTVAARPIDIGLVVKDTMDGSAALVAAEGFEVSLDIESDLPAVAAEEDAIRRALQNLVTNALKYGAEGRWLAVSVRQGTARGRKEVLVSVSDRGRGIDADDLTHIFDPFYRGRHAIDRQIHGNGLGLSLVRRIAEAHGGRVSVTSARGEGATFTLHLPAAPPDAPVQSLVEPVTTPGGQSA